LALGVGVAAQAAAPVIGSLSKNGIRLAVILCALCAQLPLAASAANIPAILDTDIGDDIDDTWALTLALKSPELDLKLVVGDYGKPLYRGKLIAKLLETARRTNVAVGLGIESGAGQKMRQEKWVEGYDLDRYPGKVHRDGVQAMIDFIMQSPEPVTLICIGPVPNIAEALRREPKIAGRARFVGMHGSVRVGYNGAAKPSAEWNVRADPKSCQAAFTAPWNMTITPLDTCGLVQLRGDKYAAVRHCPDLMVKALIENYRIWDEWSTANGQKSRGVKESSSILFDCVAIYLAMSNDLCVMEQVPLRVDDQGYTREAPDGKVVNAALAWRDLPGFENWLVQRLTGHLPGKAAPPRQSLREPIHDRDLPSSRQARSPAKEVGNESSYVRQPL